MQLLMLEKPQSITHHRIVETRQTYRPTRQHDSIEQGFAHQTVDLRIFEQ